MMSKRGEGVMENTTNLDKGREGVKNPGNFADVIYTWPLITMTPPASPSRAGEFGLTRLGSSLPAGLLPLRRLRDRLQDWRGY